MHNLPQDLIEDIEAVIQLRTADLKKYVNAVNSDDKLMLMAVPIAREVIEGVVFDDVNLPRTQPWVAASASQDRRNPTRLRYHTTMGERITSVELLAHKYAKQMVDRYRST
jgi:hypothetical protein